MITRQQYSRLRSNLTRAKNSGNPQKILSAVTNAIETFNANGPWPDDWAIWRVELEQAAWAAQRTADDAATPEDRFARWKFAAHMLAESRRLFD